LIIQAKVRLQPDLHRRSTSEPLTGTLQTVPEYATRRSVVLSGTAVPLSAYGHAFAAVPVVVQLSVAPLSVPLAVPLTGTPAHVAV
jgi:hypothetical protein